MEDFTLLKTPQGWRVVVPGPQEEPVTLELVQPKLVDGVVKGVLVVRCGEALVSEDIVTLTSAARRSQFLKRLKLLGIVLTEKAILALDEVWARPKRRQRTTRPVIPPLRGATVRQPLGHKSLRRRTLFRVPRRVRRRKPLGDKGCRTVVPLKGGAGRRTRLRLPQGLRGSPSPTSLRSSRAPR
jgi:hypothetical protein